MLDLQEHGDAIIVRVSGDLDLSNSAEFERALDVARDGREGPIVLDFGDCRYIDSSIVSVVVRCRRSVGRRLRVVCATGSTVMRILEVLRLIGPLDVVPSVDEALAAPAS
ncbi:MAG: STAS domain-containing protein [Candidatus Eremiobacteraeota bacterium]|nr:STAS domain-containing protein [Candidatus Eremiobacteraeota bacterium]